MWDMLVSYFERCLGDKRKNNNVRESKFIVLRFGCGIEGFFFYIGGGVNW